MNKVIITGHLTKDPEFATTNSGVSVCRLNVAVRRKYANENGEHDADFINVVTWRGAADNCNKYLKKGNKVGVIGSFQTRSYEAQDGTTKYVTEINAEEVEFLTNKNKTENGNSPEPTLEPIEDDGNLPF